MNYYTTVEQSKKLLELGMNSESADMIYTHKTVFYNMMENRLYVDEDDDWHLHQRSEIAFMDTGNEIFAWSLGALLDVMPKEITDKDDIDYKLLLDVKDGFPKYYSTSYEVYHGDFPYPMRDEGKTLFEYLVEGVDWLLENGYIKK